MSSGSKSMRIPAPNYTQTPNDLFDHWLPHLGEVELKVLLVIMRKTFGWHKTRDRISLSQLEILTGSTQTNIGTALKGLISKGLISREVIGTIGKQQTYYELVIIEDSNNSYPSYGGRGTPPDSGGETPPTVGGTKETITKETLKEKQQVVVVKENIEQKVDISEFDQRILFTDIQALNFKCNKGWTFEELEISWKIYEKSDQKISSPFEYIEGIIKNLRVNKNNKENNQCNQQKKILKKQSKKDNSIPAENAMSESLLARFSPLYGCKKN